LAYLNFSWVLEGYLAGAEGPTRRRDLIFLKMKGIAAIIRMEEMTISGEADELVDYFEPVPDFHPPNPQQIERMVRFIEEQSEKWERPVVVTCHAGIGRTGTVLACYLVHAGYKPGNAVNLIRKLRPGSIQTREQEKAVLEYYQLLEDKERDRRRNALKALEGL
jgi:atypical dual specificity phosphatase